MLLSLLLGFLFVCLLFPKNLLVEFQSCHKESIRDFFLKTRLNCYDQIHYIHLPPSLQGCLLKEKSSCREKTVKL